jgi:hypothetical protein
MELVYNSFFKKLSALCSYPELILSENFPQDVKNRAREILDVCQGQSTGEFKIKNKLHTLKKINILFF